jgi:hypothetical protein
VTLLRSRTARLALIAVGATAFAVVAVMLVAVPPVDGYETSLIAAYPPTFWAAFGVVLVAATLLFVAAGVDDARSWRAAFALLAADYGVFFFLPAHRGYRLYDRGNADSLAHLGDVKEVLQTGEVSNLFYPIEHLLLSELSMVGLSTDVARYLFSLVFTLLFIAAVGVLLRRMTGEARAVGFGLCAASPLVFAYFQVRIHPAIFSFLFVPLLLFLVERVRSERHRADLAAFALVAVTLVFFHPMTVVLVCLLLIATVVVQRGYGRLGGVASRRLSPRLAVIFLPPALLWYSGHPRTGLAMEGILAGLLAPTTGTLAADRIQETQAAGFTEFQLVVRFFQKYGVVFLVCVLAGLFVLIVAIRLSRRESSYEDVFVASQFLVGIGVTVTFLTVYLIAFDPVRVSRYMIVMAVLATGLLLYRATTDGIRIRGRSVGRAVVAFAVLLIVATAFLGTFAGSTYWVNSHMTETEYQGAEFVLDTHDRDLNVYSHDLQVKMQLFVYGDRNGMSPPIGRDYRVPNHLGYRTNDTAWETYGRAYVVTQDHDTQFYRADYYTPEQQRSLFVYTERDRRRMRWDPTVHQVYTNGGFEGRLVANRTVAPAPGAAVGANATVRSPA